MRIFLIVLAILFQSSLHLNAEEKKDILAAQNVISDQISAFLSGDAERAFSHAAPGIKKNFSSPDKFIAMVKGGYLPLFLPNEFRFTQSKRADTVLFQELIVTGEKGGKWRAGYSLKQQPDGSWKITGVVLRALAGDAI